MHMDATCIYFGIVGDRSPTAGVVPSGLIASAELDCHVPFIVQILIQDPDHRLAFHEQMQRSALCEAEETRPIRRCSHSKKIVWMVF